MRARYRTYHTTSDYILIEDTGHNAGCITVTNDVMNVAADMVSHLNGRRLFYIDSSGQIDEILIRSGRFIGFRAGFGGFDQLPGSPV